MNTAEKFTSANQYPRHAKAYVQGGIHLKEDADSGVNTRDVLLNLIKSVGGKLKEGKILDLLKISRPAIISYPKTYLECMAGDFIYTEFLSKAAEATDPIERLKYITAFYIAGLHVNPIEMGNNGPLNPIIGETYFAEKEDGTKIWCEQISHHPPVTAYLLEEGQGAYRVYGTGETIAKMAGMNGIDAQRAGEVVIEFKDQAKIFVRCPEMRIDGLVMGDRTINYTKSFALIDQKNKVSAEINFNYVDVGTLGKMTSAFKSFFRSPTQSDKPLYDTFNVTFYSFDADKETNGIVKTEKSKGSGSWLSYLEVDGDLLWKINTPVTQTWKTIEEKKLESDSSLRLDSKYIKEKNYDKAQKEKDLLENLQRADAKLRKTNVQKA